MVNDPLSLATDGGTMIIKDNVCTPSIPAGLKYPSPSKTISLITCVGAYLNTLSGRGFLDGLREAFGLQAKDPVRQYYLYRME